MSLYLAVLPDEIVDLILGHFDQDEANFAMARLLQCNTALRHRFEARLYSPGRSRDRLIRLACERGLTETLKLAVRTYGADPSLVTSWQEERSFKVLTLHLAAKRMQSDAFAMLLELGARVDVEPGEKSIRSQIFAIINALQHEHENMLHPFFLSGTAAQVPHIPIADDCLVQAIINRASPETVRLLLDHGANPNRLVSGAVPLSALSAAAMTGATETFRLLLHRGADVNLRKYESHVKSLFEVPVIAAAHAMAEFQSMEIMQLCLDHGAALDTTIALTHERPPRPDTLISPLTVYLDAVVDWRIDFALSPFDAVSYMLNHLRQGTGFPASPSEMYNGTDHFRIGKATELLISKLGVGFLAIDEVFYVARLLAENAGIFDLRGILKARLYEPISTYLIDGLDRLLEIVDILLKPRDLTARGKILYNLILDCANFGVSYMGESAEVLIDHLMESGADINAREHGDEDSRTILHAVCDLIDKETRDHEQRCSWYYVNLCQWDIEQRGGLLRTIVQKGADPKLHSNGKDALDRLLGTPHVMKETRLYATILAGYLNYNERPMKDLPGFEEIDERWLEE